jgi:uncharacterized protein YggE
MRIRSVLLIGLMVLLLCMNAVAEDKGTIQVPGIGSVVIPADTITIAVRAQSNINNTTQATIANGNLLNKTTDALLATGVKEDEILPGHSSGLFTYTNRVCNTMNNTTTCKYETTNQVMEQMTIKMNRDENKVNKTLEVFKSTGAVGTISGYSLSDTKKVVDEVKKKAIENAQQNAQDYASAYGFTLGKVTGISESPYTDIEIGRSRGPNLSFGQHNPFSMRPFGGPGHFFGRETLQPGMAYVKVYVWVTYEIS